MGLLKEDMNIDSVKSTMIKHNMDLEIDRIPYQVIEVPGLYHHDFIIPYSNYWCYPRNQEVSIDNLLIYNMGDEPVTWGIDHKFYTYRVSSPKDIYYSDINTIERASCISITRNGDYFCDVEGDYNDAISVLNKIRNHKYIDFNSYDYISNIVGRDIYFCGKPARIEHYLKGQTKIVISLKEKDDSIDYSKINNICCYDEDELRIKLDIFNDCICWK